MKYNGFYLVGNYPDPKTFLQAATTGLQYFDFIEIGLPFSDPVADGPVLSAAAHKALKNGTTTQSVLDSICQLKDYVNKHNMNTKIYIMTYANKVFHNGIEYNLKIFAGCGINGIILADVPFVESQRFVTAAKQCGLEYIHFITPESTEQQIKETSAQANGFIYTISLRGTTGSSLTLSDEVKHILTLTKQHAIVPVVLGFGIQSKADAQQALMFADGFIIGTALVKKLEEGFNSYKQFVEELMG
jgi:tryptophan synthase alpha chain